MDSTQRKCAAPDCQRRPQSGWAFCTDHLDAYLDRAMRIGQWQRDEVPDYLKPIDELENRLLHGDR